LYSYGDYSHPWCTNETLGSACSCSSEMEFCATQLFPSLPSERHQCQGQPASRAIVDNNSDAFSESEPPLQVPEPASLDGVSRRGGMSLAFGALLQSNLDGAWGRHLDSHRSSGNMTSSRVEPRTSRGLQQEWDPSMPVSPSSRGRTACACNFVSSVLQQRDLEARPLRDSHASGSMPQSNSSMTHGEEVQADAVINSPPSMRTSLTAHSFGGSLVSREFQQGDTSGASSSFAGESIQDNMMDEAAVSIMGFDSPRNIQQTHHSRNDQQSQEHDAYSFGNTTAASGFLHSPTSNLASARGMSRSGEAVVRASLNAELTDMLQRLALENLPVEESIIRSVRRVLQLGSVLSGVCLSDEEIHALPKIVFNESEQQNCPICLEAYQKGDLLTSLSCAHFFHVDCLARWFQRSTQCPLCRERAC